MIDSKKELSDTPVICGADFGHTNPMITFPVGGKVSLEAQGSKVRLTITEH